MTKVFRSSYQKLEKSTLEFSKSLGSGASKSNLTVVVQFGLFSVLPRRALRLGGEIGVKVSTAGTPRAQRFAES